MKLAECQKLLFVYATVHIVIREAKEQLSSDND